MEYISKAATKAIYGEIACNITLSGPNIDKVSDIIHKLFPLSMGFLLNLFPKFWP